MHRYFLSILAVFVLLAFAAGCEIPGNGSSEPAGLNKEDPAPDPDAYLRPGYIGEGSHLTYMGRVITPAGTTVSINRFPVSIALSPDGQTLIAGSTKFPAMTILSADPLQVLDTDNQGIPFYGATFNAAGDKFWQSMGASHKILEYTISGGVPAVSRSLEMIGYPAGMKLSADESVLWVAMNLANEVVAFDLASGTVIKYFITGNYPYDVVLDNGKVYASNWGEESLTVADEASAAVIGEIPVGKAPEGMALDAANNRLYVTSADTDTITVIDTSEDTVIDTWDLHDQKSGTIGAMPNAAEVTADGSKLYVTEAGYNCVSVIDTAEGSILGRIPVGQYPNDLELDEQAAKLYVVNGKGTGSAGAGRVHRQWYGSVTAVDLPDSAQLAAYTQTVEQDYMWFDNLFDTQGAQSPIPFEFGQPSEQIKKVVFILKENRTYDQLLGDMTEGEGDPELCDFCDVTPNHHKLTRTYALLDNYYVEADTSIIGHFWATAANCNDFAEKTWLSGGRVPASDMEHAATLERKTVFHNMLDNGIEFRAYGQIIGLATDLDRFAPYIDFKYSFWNMRTSDENEKVEEIIREMEAGIFPPFVYIVLPNDHTYGSSSGSPTMDYMVGDNDAGLGKLIDYLSHRPDWNEIAVFVTEDDPQAGTDHIDPHRTIGMAISPWVKRGHVSSVFYTMSSIWMTIELILGVPPMSKWDEYAAPMYDLFTMDVDTTPYEYEPNPVAPAVNAKGLPMQEYCDNANWNAPDQVERLAEVTWLNKHPGEPFPYYYSVGWRYGEEGEEEEAQEARQYVQDAQRALEYARKHGLLD
ncbi:MAG: alkaline phosphatase family protein [Candidatus Alcyoniella australis]|nr:alkaline phosphatase family protein [Candidatus Alcyoniella australis]